MASASKYLRFSFGVADRVSKELDGVDFDNLDTFINDNEKMLQVVQIAIEEGGVKNKDEAKRLALLTTRGEVIQRYCDDLGISFLKKMLPTIPEA